ncbi:MAG: PEGA domain-containing protein [Myxococcales bacterium]
MRRILPASLLMLSLSGAGAARADEPPLFISMDRVASDLADDLTKKALALAKAGKWTDARDALQEAFELKRSYDIAGNLGIVEAHLERWRDAAEHLKYAFKTFPGNGKPEQKKRVELTLAKVLPRVGALKIDVNVGKADVIIDGRTVGTTPLPDVVFVEPGRRTVVVKRPGYDDESRGVDVAPGSNGELSFSLRPETKPKPPPDEPTPRPPLWLVIATGALGAGGIATGAALAAAANGKGADAEALRGKLGADTACGGAPTGAVAASCKALRDAGAQQTTFSNASVGAFVVGGALAVTSAGLGAWYVATRKGEGKRATWNLRWTPVVSGREGGLVVSGEW